MFWSVQFWGPYSTLQTPAFDQFCCPQKFLGYQDTLTWVQGTTKSNKNNFFVCISPWRGIHYWENNQKNVTVGVGKRPQSVILFLSCCVPKSQVYHATINLDGGGIVVENGRNVLSWKLILGVAELMCFYLMRMQVFPTAPSPTTTSLIEVGSYINNYVFINEIIALLVTLEIFIFVLSRIQHIK